MGANDTRTIGVTGTNYVPAVSGQFNSSDVGYTTTNIGTTPFQSGDFLRAGPGINSPGNKYRVIATEVGIRDLGTELTRQGEVICHQTKDSSPIFGKPISQWIRSHAMTSYYSLLESKHTSKEGLYTKVWTPTSKPD